MKQFESAFSLSVITRGYYAKMNVRLRRCVEDVGLKDVGSARSDDWIPFTAWGLSLGASLMTAGISSLEVQQQN